MPVRTPGSAVIAAAAVLVAAACNGGGDEDDVAGITPTQPPATATVEASPAPEVCPRIDGEVVQSVVALLELDEPTLSYTEGQAVEMTLRVVNCAQTPIARSFPDAQRYDFAVATADDGGEEVWRWSADMTFAEVLGEETLGPGEEMTFSESWAQVDSDGQPVAPGRYQLQAETTGCDASLQNCGAEAVLFIEITAP